MRKPRQRRLTGSSWKDAEASRCRPQKHQRATDEKNFQTLEFLSCKTQGLLISEPSRSISRNRSGTQHTEINKCNNEHTLCGFSRPKKEVMYLQETAALTKKTNRKKQEKNRSRSSEMGSDVHNLCEKENSADRRGELVQHFTENRISGL